MAYLSSYLGGGTSSPGRRQTQGSYYPTPRKYQPYSVPRRGVSGIEQGSSPFQGQDLASALLYQRQASQASLPSTQFDQSYDYDPILSKIQALSAESVANSQTDASALRRQALIASGATGIGQSLGFNPDDLSAAGQNPESEMSVLQRQFAERQQQLQESMAAQNLLYSGEYARQLDLLGQGRASAEAGIGSRLKDMLSGIDAGVLNSQEAARQAELQAAQEAAMQRQYGGYYNPATGGYDYPGSNYSGGSDPLVEKYFGPGRNPGEVVNFSMPDGSGMRTMTLAEAAQINEAYWNNQYQAAPVAPVASPPPPDSGVVDPISTYLGGGLGIS